MDKGIISRSTGEQEALQVSCTSSVSFRILAELFWWKTGYFLTNLQEAAIVQAQPCVTRVATSEKPRALTDPLKTCVRRNSKR